jgi:hypothetical protein
VSWVVGESDVLTQREVSELAGATNFGHKTHIEYRNAGIVRGWGIKGKKLHFGKFACVPKLEVGPGIENSLLV